MAAFFPLLYLRYHVALDSDFRFLSRRVAGPVFLPLFSFPGDSKRIFSFVSLVRDEQWQSKAMTSFFSMFPLRRHLRTSSTWNLSRRISFCCFFDILDTVFVWLQVRGMRIFFFLERQPPPVFTPMTPFSFLSFSVGSISFPLVIG